MCDLEGYLNHPSCDARLISSTTQRIVSHNSQKSMLVCMLQIVTGCCGTSLSFWHTVLDILYCDILNLYLI